MKLLLPLCVLLLISCGDRSIHMNLDDLSKINPKYSYPLDSIVDRMEVIPLESTNKCLIEDIVSFSESNNYYYILSGKNQALYKFDKSGKFVSKIGNRGQGPGEYVSIDQIEIDNNLGIVYVLDYLGQSLLLYDCDDNYIRSYKLPEDHSFNKFVLWNDGIYYFSTNNSIMPDVVFYNTQNLIFENVSKGERKMQKGEFYFGDTFPFFMDNELCFYHYFNDTIYCVNDNNLICKELLKLGKYKVTFDDLKDIFNIRNKKIQIENLLSLSRFIFIFYTVTRYDDKGRKGFMALKCDGNFYPHVNLVSKKFISINNASPFFVSKKSLALIRCVSPSELENSFFVDYNIDLEDNPVLLIYYLNK